MKAPGDENRENPKEAMDVTGSFLTGTWRMDHLNQESLKILAVLEHR